MIYVVGDSHTGGVGNEKPTNLNYEYNLYSEYLGELFNMEVTNLGHVGQPLTKSLSKLLKNLKDIIDNGKIVIFQFQFFQNSFLRFKASDLNWKEFAVAGENPGGGPITGIGNWELLKKEGLVNDEDKYHLIHWFWKFEERREYYFMEEINALFDSLEKMGIKCYMFYWCKPSIIELIDNHRVIKFDNEHGKTIILQEAMKFNNMTDIRYETNGVWDDNHLGSNGNKILAENIYKYILNN